MTSTKSASGTQGRIRTHELFRDWCWRPTPLTTRQLAYKKSKKIIRSVFGRFERLGLFKRQLLNQ